MFLSDTTDSRAPDQGLSLDDRDPDFIRFSMPFLEWFHRYYFRVQTSGWHHIPQGKVLFVGSHNGGLAAPDMHMFMYDWFSRFGYDRLVYGLAHPKVWQVYSPLATLAARFGAIRANPRMAIAAFQRGASVLVYPGGGQDVFRPHRLRHRIYFAKRKGFIKLALREQVPIVPLISYGAHDTLIVLENCYEQAKWLHERGFPWLFNIDPEVFPIYLGLPWGIAVGPVLNIPWPTPIHTRVCQPIWFKHYGRETLNDKDYINSCYNQVVNHMQADLNKLILEYEVLRQ